jgi:tRNA threonylcarbamoyladenosine biosynthesis protein TsaE
VPATPKEWSTAVPGTLELRTGDADATKAVGAVVAEALRTGDVVSLTGELGAGKTCFVQGAAAALGVQDRVTSPSFLLRRDYEGRLPVTHLDVYRLETLQEVLELGFGENTAVVFVEWGDAMRPLLPAEHLEVELMLADGQLLPGSTGGGESPGAADGVEAEPRRIRLHPHGDEWRRRLRDLERRLAPWKEQ